MATRRTTEAQELETLRRRVAELERASQGQSRLPAADRDAEQRHADRALRESEERFRTLVGNVPGAVYRCEVGWPYRDVILSEGVEALTGYSAAWHLRDPDLAFGTLIFPEDRTRIETAVETAVRDHSAFLIRYRIRHAGGGVRWVQEQGRAAYDANDSPLFLDGVMVDVTAQVLAEQQLREREERLRTIVENEPECVKLLDREGNLLEMNPAGLRMIEADTLERVRGRCVCPLVTPADEPAFRAMIAAAFRGETCNLVFDIVGLKGTRRTLETHSVPLWDGPEHTAVRALLGVTRDITERRQAEAARDESEERFRSLVASVPGAVYLCQIEAPWKDVFMSEGVWALTGHRHEEFLRTDGITVNTITLEADLPRVEAEVKSALERRGVYESRYRIRHADGSLRWMYDQGRGVYDREGRARFLTGVILDITDRMAAEEALRASQARLVEAQRIAGIGSWELNLSTGKLTWSDEAYRIFELDPREFGASYEAFLATVHPEDRELVDRTYTEAVEQRKPYDMVHRLLLRDGRVKYVHERAETHYGSDGRPVRSLGTAQDITEQRQAEQTRQALEAQLRQAQKMEAIGTLAGGIAHDFNNILTAIMGHAELLGQDLPPDPALREEVDGILGASQRARDLVQQILTFSRRRVQERKPIALQPVVLEALRMLRATLPTTIEIRAEVSSEAAVVMADATQVYQVVINLCGNAAHAMRDHGGILSVSCGGVQVDEAFASAHRGLRPGRHVLLTVSDTGHGMDPQTVERIFDPFFTTKGPGEGTGLGLAVLHGIMQAHDGLVTVHSQPGKGTSFNLYFPAARGPAPATTGERRALPRGGGEHILVVDDEPALVGIARRALGQLGYRVTGYTHPAEALAEFRQDPRKFDLVLCDLTMPQMSGLDFAGQLLQIRPEIPMLLTSGNGAALEPDALHRLGIRELLDKPFTIQALAEAARRNLEPRG